MQTDSELESTVLLVKLDQRASEMVRRIDHPIKHLSLERENITWFKYNNTTD